MGHLKAGRALEIGCGLRGRGNAVWLAGNGWQVTAFDYSTVAIAKGKQLAVEHHVSINFIVAYASIHEPNRCFDLIICFYIPLFPVHRVGLLRKMFGGLSTGCTFLFVSHDASGYPSGWLGEDLLSLTNPQEIAEYSRTYRLSTNWY
jgi:ubiquinone/menaquinone biosynthesis C-methylase UbiE